MVKIGTDKEYLDLICSLPRPGEEKYLAFYEHRLGMIFTNPRFLLIPLDDHLVHRGDGIFETLQCVDGKIYQLDAHLKRMLRSCEIIDLMLPCTSVRLRELVIETARAAGEKDLILNIYVGQGPGGFTVDSRECPAPSLYIVARRPDKHPADFWEKGVLAVRSSFSAEDKRFAPVKSVNYLRKAIMKREAVAAGCEFPLCFNEEGFLSDGATESVVVVKQGKILIPDCQGKLPGTTVHRAMELIASEIPSVLWAITDEILQDVSEIILLGTGIDAVSVVRYNGRIVGDGKPGVVSKRLLELLRQDSDKDGVYIYGENDGEK